MCVLRFHSRTTVKKIVDHVCRETGITLRVESLQTRYDSHAFFYIYASTWLNKMLLAPFIWSSGTVIRDYIERYYIYQQ